MNDHCFSDDWVLLAEEIMSYLNQHCFMLGTFSWFFLCNNHSNHLILAILSTTLMFARPSLSAKMFPRSPTCLTFKIQFLSIYIDYTLHPLQALHGPFRRGWSVPQLPDRSLQGLPETSNWACAGQQGKVFSCREWTLAWIWNPCRPGSNPSTVPLILYIIYSSIEHQVQDSV